MLTAFLIVCYRSRDYRDIRRSKQIPKSRCIFHWLCPCTAPRPPGPAGTRLGGRGRGSKPPSDHRPCRAPATPARKTSAAGSARRRSEVRGGSDPRRAPVSGPAPAPTSPGLYQGLSRSGLTSGTRPRQREGGVRLRVRAALPRRREGS